MADSEAGTARSSSVGFRGCLPRIQPDLPQSDGDLGGLEPWAGRHSRHMAFMLVSCWSILTDRRQLNWLDQESEPDVVCRNLRVVAVCLSLMDIQSRGCRYEI